MKLKHYNLSEMTPKERKAYNEYCYLLWRDYPYPEPCIHCFYWSGKEYRKKRQSYGMIMPHCNYLDITGELRGSLPNLKAKTCDKFRPRQSIRPKKKKKEIFF